MAAAPAAAVGLAFSWNTIVTRIWWTVGTTTPDEAGSD